ncbi:unnamed protein product [Protopolystoma xenopodis]|uniref:Uncharacterized protein n=1 Tax=Protopolystoma xenopodis TaxID=117903 RepID=A0A3S5CIH1_9PLAT|nr:unnamed protein product [Protopolystoma xenopodis]
MLEEDTSLLSEDAGQGVWFDMAMLLKHGYTQIYNELGDLGYAIVTMNPHFIWHIQLFTHFCALVSSDAAPNRYQVPFKGLLTFIRALFSYHACHYLVAARQQHHFLTV